MCRFERGLVADVLHRLKVLRRGVVSGLGLHQCGLRSVQIAAGNRTFGEELLAAVDDAVVEVKIGLGLGVIQFCLLRIFRNLRPGRCCIGCLRGFVGAFIVLCRADEIGILEHREELAFFHPGSALDQKSFYGRADFGCDGGLREGSKNSVGGDVVGDCALFRMFGLHGDFRRGCLLLLAACREKSGEQNGGGERTCMFDALPAAHAEMVVASNRFVHGFLHRSSQSLQSRKCSFVAHAPVFAGILRSDKSRLCIDHFKHGGFAAGVTHLGEPQAFCRRGDAQVERSQLIAGCLGFGIGFIQLRDQAALGCGQRHLGDVALDLALLHLVRCGQPVPHGNIERDRGRVAQIVHSIRALHGKLWSIDAIGVVEAEAGQICAASGQDICVAHSQCGERTLQLGVVFGCELVNVGTGRKRCRSLATR